MMVLAPSSSRSRTVVCLALLAVQLVLGLGQLAAAAENAASIASLKQHVQQHLRESLDVESDGDAQWYMYISGSSPFCGGTCIDNGVQSTLLRTIKVPYSPGEASKSGFAVQANTDSRVASWSGNANAFGSDCSIGSKAICVTQQSTDKTQAPWEFPMCGPNPDTSSTEQCVGCTGCPKGTIDNGEWSDTSGAVCCLADNKYSLNIDWDRQTYCNSLGISPSVWKARKCKFDASTL